MANILVRRDQFNITPQGLRCVSEGSMSAMERTTYRPIPLFLSDLQDQPDPRASEPFAVIQRTSINEGAEPSKTLDAETLAALITRAKSLLALGDIAVARLLLERAANAQDATAAFLLAQTYDPAVLGVRDTRSITPDPRMARDWYRKAASFGSTDAQQRLTQPQN